MSFQINSFIHKFEMPSVSRLFRSALWTAAHFETARHFVKLKQCWHFPPSLFSRAHSEEHWISIRNSVPEDTEWPLPGLNCSQRCIYCTTCKLRNSRPQIPLRLCMAQFWRSNRNDIKRIKQVEDKWWKHLFGTVERNSVPITMTSECIWIHAIPLCQQ